VVIRARRVRRKMQAAMFSSCEGQRKLKLVSCVNDYRNWTYIKIIEMEEDFACENKFLTGSDTLSMTK